MHLVSSLVASRCFLGATCKLNFINFCGNLNEDSQELLRFRCYLRKDLNSQESEGIRMMDPFMRYVPLTCGCGLLGRRTDNTLYGSILLCLKAHIGIAL